MFNLLILTTFFVFYMYNVQQFASKHNMRNWLHIQYFTCLTTSEYPKKFLVEIKFVFTYTVTYNKKHV